MKPEIAEDRLMDYRRKRNFKATPEPEGVRAQRRKAARFVVQKHAASHLHYDFRLELDGTLKSWAVPKGPSLDPQQKRLALQVEDHPLSYADFEGIIPPGNYGAGTVIVWDSGEWEPIEDPADGYRTGRLKFKLRGKKLKGIWNLVRSSKDRKAWFLIKHADAAARPAAYSIVEEQPDSVLGGASGKVWRSKRAAHAPANKPAGKTPSASRAQAAIPIPTAAKKSSLPLMMAPQLATLVDSIPIGKGWHYEMKFDGYRLLTRIDKSVVRLFTRNGNDWTAKLAHLSKALASLDVESAWLDGEIIMLDDRDRPSFQMLQNAFESTRTGNIQYYLFDLLYLNGYDLRSVPLSLRREMLAALLKKPPASVFFSKTFDVPTRDLFAHVCDLQLEGLIGKRADSIYHAGRSREWIKLKCLQRQEFIICGYTDPSGSRTGTFGSLLLGIHDPETGKLRYAGRVGTGFTDTTLRQLMTSMQRLRVDDMPFEELTGERPSRAMHWLKPKLVGEVAFSEWTEAGHIRHPSFQGLRSDKVAADITTEKPVAARALKKSTPQIPPNRSGRISKTTKTTRDAVQGIAITHPDRIVDSASGVTKMELAEFYSNIAPLILPHLKDRPVSLVRAPDGIDGPHFFQKHMEAAKMPHLRQLDKKLFPGHPPLVMIDSVAALIACAQMNVVELHTWNATIHAIKHPDRMIFDIDPGDGIDWPQIQQATHLTKALLDELHLKSFLKTSGGKGLHVVVPLEPVADWDTVKNLSQRLVQHMAKTLPALFVAKSGPKNRINRIFVDYLRNGFGATTACAFSARARAGLGVSIPVSWKDLDRLKSSAEWTVRDWQAILALAKKQPWKGYAAVRQNLQVALQRL
ncbi:MAG TPA: DNA ligase D [Spongiibacteraceae bacterium]|nr:DNA ligase D [Spongiibacteraceae bacterium]